MSNLENLGINVVLFYERKQKNRVIFFLVNVYLFVFSSFPCFHTAVI